MKNQKDHRTDDSGAAKRQMVIEDVVLTPWKIEFLFSLRKIVKKSIQKDVKVKVKIYDEECTDGDEGATSLVNQFLKEMNVRINGALSIIKENIKLDKDDLIDNLTHNDSLFIIKMHLITQELLWVYIKNKLGSLPRQYDNWDFSKVLDLADVFHEIPEKIINYLGKLNTLRNRIAHKPKSFKFSNINSSDKTTIYHKANGSVLFGICDLPDNDYEIMDDWISLFLVSLVVIGGLMTNRGPIKYRLGVDCEPYKTTSPSGFDLQ